MWRGISARLRGRYLPSIISLDETGAIVHSHHVRKLDTVSWYTFGALISLLAAAGCTESVGPDTLESFEQDVRVDTSSGQSRAQYDANMAFLQTYAPRCAQSRGALPRILVTGFGRFLSVVDNASGRTVAAAIPSLVYPLTVSPDPGQVDPPDAQLAVGSQTVHLPGFGPVDACGMILPTYWDVAAVLVAKEIEAFDPDLVLMNGVANPVQKLWLELGAMNRAGYNVDGSGNLEPAQAAFEAGATLVEGAPVARGNLLSWKAVQHEMTQAIAQQAAERQAGQRFDSIVLGVTFGGYPRLSNDYLCNNLTYTVGYLMDHAQTAVTLFQASDASSGQANGVEMLMRKDRRSVPRGFVHWPSALAGAHVQAASKVLLSVASAQLRATQNGDRPVPGDNAWADESLSPDQVSSNDSTSSSFATVSSNKSRANGAHK